MPRRARSRKETLSKMKLGTWDVLLLAGVSLQAVAMAYAYQPVWKALIWNLPVPFTLASLSLGRDIDATNVGGLILLFVYAHGVRMLHVNLKVPIVPAIAVAAFVYVVIGATLAPLVPTGGWAFWCTTAAGLAVAWVAYRLTPRVREAGHRSPLPVYLKVPAIVAVILLLLALKSVLGGFMTFFPMVGVVACYEARHSLWAICRQLPVIVFTFVPFMAVVRLTQNRLGLGMSLLLGWAVLLLILVPVTRHMCAKAAAPDHQAQPDGV